MNPKRIALLAGLTLILVSGDVYADDPKPLPAPHVKLTTGPGTLDAPNGEHYLLPVGTHILDGTSYDKLDDKLKENENLATRYKAENDSLKKSLDTWQPGWGTLIVLTGLALVGGTVAYYVN
jgi:hypothetical protein